jgi:hypothetical protein
MDSAAHPKLSFTAVEADALYRVYRVQSGQETVVAELKGQPGDSLEYTDTVSGGEDLRYYVRPVNDTLFQEGVLLEGDMSQMVKVAQTNPLFDWMSRPEPTPTPLPVREQPALFQ